MTMVAKPNNAMTMQKNKDKITIEDVLRERERERETERWLSVLLKLGLCSFDF
jgi:hypothetical protein